MCLLVFFASVFFVINILGCLLVFVCISCVHVCSCLCVWTLYARVNCSRFIRVSQPMSHPLARHGESCLPHNFVFGCWIVEALCSMPGFGPVTMMESSRFCIRRSGEKQKNNMLPAMSIAVYEHTPPRRWRSLPPTSSDSDRCWGPNTWAAINIAEQRSIAEHDPNNFDRLEHNHSFIFYCMLGILGWSASLKRGAPMKFANAAPSLTMKTTDTCDESGVDSVIYHIYIYIYIP